MGSAGAKPVGKMITERRPLKLRYYLLLLSVRREVRILYQTCSAPGRSIFSNVVLLRDVFDYKLLILLSAAMFTAFIFSCKGPAGLKKGWDLGMTNAIEVNLYSVCKVVC